jgi:Holliday junction resolvase-like predicted endonuclease
MKMEQSVPKRRHIKFRRRAITQKKTYNILNTAKVWNQEHFILNHFFFFFSLLLWNNTEGYFKAGQATENDMVYFLCMPDT